MDEDELRDELFISDTLRLLDENQDDWYILERELNASKIYRELLWLMKR